MNLGRVLKTTIAITAMQFTPACKADRAPHVLVTAEAQRVWPLTMAEVGRPSAARQVLDTFGEHNPPDERVLTLGRTLNQENEAHVNNEVSVSYILTRNAWVRRLLGKESHFARPRDAEHRDFGNPFNFRGGTSLYLGHRAIQLICLGLGTCGLPQTPAPTPVPVPIQPIIPPPLPIPVPPTTVPTDGGMPAIQPEARDAGARRDVVRRPVHIRQPGPTQQPGQTQQPGPVCIPIPGIRVCP